MSNTVSETALINWNVCCELLLIFSLQAMTPDQLKSMDSPQVSALTSDQKSQLTSLQSEALKFVEQLDPKDPDPWTCSGMVSQYYCKYIHLDIGTVFLTESLFMEGIVDLDPVYTVADHF